MAQVAPAAFRMTPDVTVVVPCYNQGRFLSECVASLERQTHRAFCAVVVDDASTDGETPALCDAAASDRVRVVHLSDNRGRAGARNVGIALAETEAILSLDADDALEPEHLARTVPLLSAHPRCGIVYTDYRIFGAESRIMRGLPFDPFELYRLQYIYAGSLFRKSAHAATPGYREAFNIGNEDWDFWLSIVEAGYFATYVPEPLYRYRRHAESWTAQPGEILADRRLASRELLRDVHRAGFERSGRLAAFDHDTWLDDARARLSLGDGRRARASLLRAMRAKPLSLRPGLLWAKSLLGGRP